MDTDKKVLGATVYLAGVTVLYLFDFLTWTQAGLMTGLLAVVTVIVFLVNQESLSQLKDQMPSQNPTLDVEDVERIADEWANGFYREERGVDISWKTDFDTVELAGGEEVVALIGARDGSNRDILLFVETKEKQKVVGKHRITEENSAHMKRYPFRYCDYVQKKLKRNRQLDEEKLREMLRPRQTRRYPSVSMPPTTRETPGKGEGTGSEDGD